MLGAAVNEFGWAGLSAGWAAGREFCLPVVDTFRTLTSLAGWR